MFFFIKVIFRAGSAITDVFLSDAATGPDCCRTSCDKLSTSSSLTSFHSPNFYIVLVLKFVCSLSHSVPFVLSPSDCHKSVCS